MGDLAALHAQARRLILSLRGGLDRLEASEGVAGTSRNATLARDMQQKLTDLRVRINKGSITLPAELDPNAAKLFFNVIRSACQQLWKVAIVMAIRDMDAIVDIQKTSTEMDSIWRMQVVRENASMRDIWKRKVEQVSEEADHLKMVMDKYSTREGRRQVEEDERAELLARRSTGGPPGWRQAGVDEEAALVGHISNSKRVLEEAYQTGTAILGNMSSQRDRLKAAQRKVLDVLNSVGLSDSLLRVIDRRQRLDRWITYGGMTVMALLLMWLWWYLKR